MSKLFKALGLSVAVGTVVYGIIKYKSDEKFKKQVDDTVEEVKEKVKETEEKVEKFAADHPVITIACCAGIIMIPIYYARKALKKEITHTIAIYQSSCESEEEEARLAAQKQAMYDDIMENPSNYYIIKKDAYEDLCQAAGCS